MFVVLTLTSRSILSTLPRDACAVVHKSPDHMYKKANLNFRSHLNAFTNLHALCCLDVWHVMIPTTLGHLLSVQHVETTAVILLDAISECQCLHLCVGEVSFLFAVTHIPGHSVRTTTALPVFVFRLASRYLFWRCYKIVLPGYLFHTAMIKVLLCVTQVMKITILHTC